jgi:hypothetical protein
LRILIPLGTYLSQVGTSPFYAILPTQPARPDH